MTYGQDGGGAIIDALHVVVSTTAIPLSSQRATKMALPSPVRANTVAGAISKAAATA